MNQVNPPRPLLADAQSSPSAGCYRRELLLGGLALASLCGASPTPSARAAAAARDPERDGGLAHLPHYAPKAKRIIYLFQSGGPAQMDLFDYKPALRDQIGRAHV